MGTVLVAMFGLKMEPFCFMPPKVVDITPGTGKVDFPKVMANLKKGGFKRGPLIVECLSPGDVSFVNAEARKTRLFLEEMMRRI